MGESRDSDRARDRGRGKEGRCGAAEHGSCVCTAWCARAAGDDGDTDSSSSTSMKAMHRLWLTVRFMWLGE